MTATLQKASVKHRLAEKGVDRVLWLLVPGAVFVILLFVYPFLYGLQLSFQPKQGGNPFQNYITFFQDEYLAETVWITLRLGLPAALFNVLASIPIAFRMRKQFRGKRALTTLLVIPITLGTVLTAEGLLAFFGPTGWFNRIWMVLGADEPARLTHNYWGVLFSLVITGFPFAFLLTLSYLSGIDPTLEQAAATLGASKRQRFRTITMPLLAPGLAVTFCLSFVLAFSVFPSAVMVGNPAGETHVMSIAAYETALRDNDFAMGSAIAMLMALVMLIVIGVVLIWRTTLYRGATGGKG